MLGAVPLILALTLGAADGRNPALAEGIRQYDAADYAGALLSLTEALDRPSSRRELARIHLYIGFIQHRFKLVKDAEASFVKALDYDPRVKLPKASTPGAKALFKKLQRLKLPEEGAEEAERRRRPRPKRPGGDGDEARSLDPAHAGATKAGRPGAGEGDAEAAGSATSRTSSAAVVAAQLDGRGEGSAAARVEGAGTVAPLPVASGGAGVPGAAAGKPPRPEDRLVPSTSAELEDGASGGPIAGWIGIGVGVAAAATGVVLGVLAAENGSAANSERLAPRAEQLHQTAVEQRTFAFVSFGVSGAALGLAAVLFLTD